MAAKARQLLGHVGAVGEQRHFLGQPRRIERDALRQLGDARRQAFADRLDLERGEPGHFARTLLDVVEPRGEIPRQRFPFAPAHHVERLDGCREPVLQRGSGGLQIRRGLPERDHPVHRREILHAGLAGQPE